MPVITFASSKGGVGKTTSAVVMATMLSRSHLVTVIDADPAGRLMRWADKAPLPGRLTVIKTRGERFIQDEIDKADQASDFVFVDLEGAQTRLNAFAMGESDLVIIPMGDEQQDAEDAIETLANLRREAKAMRREIPVRILFCRTKTAVKSRLEASLNEQVRNSVGAFTTELYARTAFASLHNLGGTLYDMDPDEVTGVAKAIGNAELLVDEMREVLGWVKDIRGWENRNAVRKEIKHGA